MARRRKKKKPQQQDAVGRNQNAIGKSDSVGAMKEALRSAFSAAGSKFPGKRPRKEATAKENAPPPKQDVHEARKKSAAKRLSEGIATQFTTHPSRGDLELVIGLDFGTSCTKVVIQDVARRVAYAVPFDELSELDNPYLLPTIIALDDEGEFNLVKRGKTFRGLKQNMMSIAAVDPGERGEHKKTLLPHTTAYLSLVFRTARAWFFRAHAEEYGGNQIVWRINVGLPASRFDEPDMPMLYRSAVRRAWYLSTLGAPVTLSLAGRIHRKTALESDNRDAVLNPGAIGAFPEVVAAVQGYAKSPERQQGLHLLIDAGASTMDVTCFRLLEHDDEDHFPIFFATISRLGGFELFRYRGDWVTSTIAEYIDNVENNLDGISEPENPLKLRFRLDEEDRIELDRDFSDKVGEAIWNVIAVTKSKRDPTAPEWSKRLPTFLCGGAAQIDLYTKALKRIDRNKNWAGRLDIRDLTLPRVVDAPGLALGHRHRMLVAFGLSFNPLDIGRLIPQSGIPDPEVDEQRKQYTEAFIGSEMV